MLSTNDWVAVPRPVQNKGCADKQCERPPLYVDRLGTKWCVEHRGPHDTPLPYSDPILALVTLLFMVVLVAAFVLGAL